jgi:hypothetical protein
MSKKITTEIQEAFSIIDAQVEDTNNGFGTASGKALRPEDARAAKVHYLGQVLAGRDLSRV